MNVSFSLKCHFKFFLLLKLNCFKVTLKINLCGFMIDIDYLQCFGSLFPTTMGRANGREQLHVAEH